MKHNTVHRLAIIILIVITLIGIVMMRATDTQGWTTTGFLIAIMAGTPLVLLIVIPVIERSGLFTENEEPRHVESDPHA